jgi:hypothetical protein
MGAPSSGGSEPLKVRHPITTFLEALSGALLKFRFVRRGLQNRNVMERIFALPNVLLCEGPLLA